jgi:hypothetical protein
MFLVEWLKADETIRKEPMLGASVGDVLKLVRSDIEKLPKTSGSRPDTIRIWDGSSGQVTVHKIEPA